MKGFGTLCVFGIMTNFGYLIVFGVFVIVLAAGGGLWWLQHRAIPVPPTPAVTTVVPTEAPSTHCALGTCPFELTATSSGEVFTYSLTSRFSVILLEATYPHNELSCNPANILGQVTNGSTPPPYASSTVYTVRYEAVATGTCMLSDRDWHTTITVVP